MGQKPDVIPSERDLVIQSMAGDTVLEINGEIRGIFQDSNDNLWFASNGEGIYRYDGKVILNFTEKHGLPSNFVWQVQESRDGKIWFKTNVRTRDVDAICNYDGKVFTTVEASINVLPAMSFNAKSDELLFDYYLRGSTLYKLKLPPTSPIQNEENVRHHYDIYATCKDRNGNFWFGTATAGICKFDGNTYQWFNDSKLGAAIRSIYEDSNGVIWVGNNGDGLFRYDGEKFVHFSKELNLHNPDFEKYPQGKPGLLSRVWTITNDKAGNLWVGTIDNGVWKYDGKMISNYTTEDGIPIDQIWIIYCDKSGKLWVGTAGAGVYNFDGNKFSKFTVPG